MNTPTLKLKARFDSFTIKSILTFQRFNDDSPFQNKLQQDYILINNKRMSNDKSNFQFIQV